jgi:hypothetical protein
MEPIVVPAHLEGFRLGDGQKAFQEELRRRGLSKQDADCYDCLEGIVVPPRIVDLLLEGDVDTVVSHTKDFFTWFWSTRGAFRRAYMVLPDDVYHMIRDKEAESEGPLVEHLTHNIITFSWKEGNLYANQQRCLPFSEVQPHMPTQYAGFVYGDGPGRLVQFLVSKGEEESVANQKAQLVYRIVDTTVELPEADMLHVLEGRWMPRATIELAEEFLLWFQ